MARASRRPRGGAAPGAATSRRTCWTARTWPPCFAQPGTGAWLLLTSSDSVFAGTAGRPYREGDVPRPATVYGMTKAAAEQEVLRRGGAVARLSLLYGWPVDPALRSTFTTQLEGLARARPACVVVDEWRTPLALGDAAAALVGLGRIGYRGVVHVGGPERMTPAVLVSRCARLLGLAPSLLAASRHSLGTEHRPADVSLDSGRLAGLLPGLLPGPVRRDVLEREAPGTAPAARQPTGPWVSAARA